MTVLADAETDRAGLLKGFLDREGLADAEVTPLADDCSFRRYFRIETDGNRFVVMDAPPDLEDIVPFVDMSRVLNGYGYSAPRILASDMRTGFLLLDDFGDRTYTRALAAGDDETALYELATDVLIDLHRRDVSDATAGVPAYEDAKLLDEAALFIDWYLVKGLGLDVTAAARDAYLGAWSDCLAVLRGAPDTLVLRDYHVDNLMVCGGRKGLAACGLLDFQDAVAGPASYDVVSLLQDSRRDISDALVDRMLERYFAGLEDGLDRHAFMLSYHGFGAQRALKVFGIFARQSVLYDNHRYLCHIPRLWAHTLANLRIPELAPVRDWIERHVPDDHRAMVLPGGGMGEPCI